MKRILLIIIFLASYISIGQVITVNTTTYTVPQLVNDVLFGSGTGGGSCAGTLSNITWKTGNSPGQNSVNGIGYFQNTNPNFPLSAGVIMTSGAVTGAPGPNNSIQSGGNNTWTGDTQLFNYIQGLGIDPGLTGYHNASVIEFDFVPLSPSFSFNFMFASEEYGGFQCQFSDAFAFFLTNVTAGTPATNIALVPSTTTPISVLTVRDNAHNPGCASVNPAYFDKYYQLPSGLNPNTSPTNFNGQTVLLTAASTVTPNDTYHIKLVVADRNDTQLDSAVFLGAGSFDIGQANISGTVQAGTNYSSQTDFTFANFSAICFGDTRVVKAGTTPITGAIYQWSEGGVPIPGATSFNYTITAPGDYEVSITYPSGCSITDTITAEYYPSLPIANPNDLTSPNGVPFDLTLNTPTILNGQNPTDYEIYYFTNLIDAQNGANVIINPTSFLGTNGGNPIYASVTDSSSGVLCTQYVSFLLSTFSVNPTQPSDLTLCENALGSNQATFNLSNQTPTVLGAYNAANYTVTYYTSQAFADAGTPQINPANAYLGNNNQVIYVRLEENANTANFGTTTFVLHTTPLPTATVTGGASVCLNATQPVITFTGANGTAPYTFNYTLNSVAQTPLTTTAGNSITINAPTGATGNFVYTLVSVSDVNCSQTQNGTTTVVVTPLPTATVTGGTTVCRNVASPVITFTGFNVASPYTFNYTLNGVAQTPLTTAAGNNSITVNAPTTTTGTFIYNITNVSSGTCSQTQNATTTVIVSPLPTASISAATSACLNATSPTVTFTGANGTTPYTFSYTIGGVAQTPVSTVGASNSVIINAPTTTDGTFTYVITNVADASCNQNQNVSTTVTINPLPIANQPPTRFACSNGATNQAQFNLTLSNPAVTGGVSGVTVSYYTSLANAQNEIAPVNDTDYTGTNGEIVYIRVENDITGCYSTTTVDLQVTQGPVANTPTPLEQCSINSDGLALFDLNSVVNQVTGGATNVSVSFHITLADANLGPAGFPIDTSVLYPNVDPDFQIIFIRVYYPLTDCFNIVQLQLIVHPTPQPITPSDYHECDDDYDGYAIFNLNSKIPEILGTSINPATTTVTFYTSLAAAELGTGNITNPGTYPNVSSPQTVWVRVETTATGCHKIVSMVLIVDPKPTLPAIGYFNPYRICDDPSRDGFEAFDLLSQENGGSNILQGQLNMSVTWYPSYAAAVAGTPSIPAAQLSNYVNTTQYIQNLGIRITNVTTGCYTLTSLDIVVEPLPLLVVPPVYTICDEDQDGVSSDFDLTTLTPIILAGGDYTLHYFDTLSGAQNNDTLNEITNLTNYENNTSAFVQYLYVLGISNVNGCQSIIQIELNVNPSPMTPYPDLADIVVCDEDANNQNGNTNVNLTVQTPIVLAAQPLPGSSYDVTYYTTAADANATPMGTNQIVNTTSYPATNGQTIWVRIENKATGCFEVVPFNIVINTPLNITQPTKLKVCDNDATPNNFYTAFDLTIKNGEILTGVVGSAAIPGYTVNYYTSFPVTASSVLITNPTAFTNTILGAQTLGVEVIDNATGCKNYTRLEINVLAIPTPRENPPVLTPKCEDAINSGVQMFDVTQNAVYIKNNNTGVTLHYFHSEADATAVPPANEIMNPTAVIIGDATLGIQAPRPVNQIQYIYVVVQNNVNSSGTNLDFNNQTCYKIVKQPFIINPLPVINDPIGPYQICEEDATGNDGFEVFDLTQYQQDILDNNTTAPAAPYVINYYTDAGHTMPISTPSSFTNTVNPQTIYYTISQPVSYIDPVSTTTHTTNCTSEGSFDIVVNPKPDIAPPLNPLPLNICDELDGANDGYYIWDLTQMNTDILAGQDPALFTVNYYESEYNPDATPPLSPTPIATPTTYNAFTHTIWAAVINNATGCFKTETIDLVVEQLPEPFITNNINDNVICVDFETLQVVRPLLLQSVNQTIPYLNPALEPVYTYQWYQDGVAIPAPEGTAGPTYLVNNLLNNNTSSVFTLEMISTNPLACTGFSQDFTVLQSGQATLQAGTVGYTVTNAFTNNQTINVTVSGFGTYQYSLDDGPRQDSPIFSYVSLGEHTIYVWDVKGGLGNSCDVFTIYQVQTIDYPLYFTPNGDGIHDYWNIQGLQNQPTAKIYVFDRFGKLIKQLSPQNEGWDGTYNGQPLPSTDYWFTVDYSEQNAIKQFKAHFSLKR